MAPETTVYVVDDDAAVRRFLRGLIESVGLRVEVYASAQEFLDAFEPDAPGCILLDIRMPGKSGLELQSELVGRGVRLPIIILTGHGDVRLAVQAMKAGAIDFIEKPFNNELMLDRIQAAVAVNLRDDRGHIRREEIANRMALLTPRERQVMDLVANGLTNKGVARHLDISERTVEAHRANVMEKMHATSFADLMRMVTVLDAD